MATALASKIVSVASLVLRVATRAGVPYGDVRVFIGEDRGRHEILAARLEVRDAATSPLGQESAAGPSQRRGRQPREEVVCEVPLAEGAVVLGLRAGRLFDVTVHRHRVGGCAEEAWLPSSAAAALRCVEALCRGLVPERLAKLLRDPRPAHLPRGVFREQPIVVDASSLRVEWVYEGLRE